MPSARWRAKPADEGRLSTYKWPTVREIQALDQQVMVETAVIITASLLIEGTLYSPITTASPEPTK